MSSEGMNLGLMQLSAVRELANIGLGHAVTSLSEITQRPFNMSVPYAESVALTTIPTMLGGGERLTVGIYMPIDGDIEGHMAFLFPWPSAQALWSMLLGYSPDSVESIGEMEASAMIEVGNIINSSFLNAISDMTGFTLHATPPLLAVDMAACVLESIVNEASMEDHAALAIETDIHDHSGSAGGMFLYIPSLGGLRALFAALGISEAA
ncbi:MAG: chemotaxis protein CheC [Fimbriimonadaceae bacterium]